jgi:glycosyltransferase involved in cell wall biosynthesis
MADVAVLCPDTNIELGVDAPQRRAIRGGKSAIVQLAAAWARRGHRVTVFAGRVQRGEDGSLAMRPLDEAEGRFDVAIWITGALGHFRDERLARVAARVNLFWINGPNQVELPAHVACDWCIAPARFLARRAIDEWGLASERLVVIPGEAVRQRHDPSLTAERDAATGVYASHPEKGLREALHVLARCRSRGWTASLDVFGTPAFWAAAGAFALPAWAAFAGDVPESELAQRMLRYGFMPYFTPWLDGFSTATAEAMAAGVVVFATAHGSNAEFVRHGWNGFLVRARDGVPDLDEGERLLAAYLREPDAFASVRENAMRSVPTWDDQAAEWVRAWER